MQIENINEIAEKIGLKMKIEDEISDIKRIGIKGLLRPIIVVSKCLTTTKNLKMGR